MTAPTSSGPEALPGQDLVDVEEVLTVARGIATAVAPETGLTDVQAMLLEAIASALTGVEVDYRGLEPLSPEELGAALAHKETWYRQRIVHHMVLGELVLRPIPPEVAFRVAQFAQALGIEDHFVRVARRYAQGAYGMAWADLRRSGFTEHLHQFDVQTLRTQVDAVDPFQAPDPDPQLAECWAAFEALPPGSLGHSVWEMYVGRGFELPGTVGGASAYLAQHDFVHVLADYGTNLKGELEVFAFIGRADPEPKGFAWLATLVGLFETGVIKDTGFFERDIREHNIQAPGMHHRIADAIRRGKAVWATYDKDLFEVDYHALAKLPVEEVREMLSVPPKSAEALVSGSVGLFDLEGMSEIQRSFAEQRAKASR
jgi:hypothetical protein